MHVLITGGAGFLGTMLTQELLDQTDAGRLDVGGRGGITAITSLDMAPSRVDDARVRSVVGDLNDPGDLADALTGGADVIVHLAAVLSGGSEQDFDLADRVNIDGTRALLDAARRQSAETDAAARFVFTSSLAVFGGDVPGTVPEHWAAQPESTYGAHKAIGELLVNEYGRKGFVDARICRLPTISVRPGRPNSAASSFASGIIREPLNGEVAPLPVPQDTRLWLSSPRVVVRNLVRAIAIDGAVLDESAKGPWRVMNLPGITVTVAEMLTALEAVAGPEARALVRDEPDAAVAAIVTSWPGAFDVERLRGLGFEADESVEDMVRQYRDDFCA